MGVIADLLANAQTFAAGTERVANDRVVTRQLQGLLDSHGDFDYPSGYDAVNEVQSIAIFGGSPSGGTFTLTFTLSDGATYTTAGIAYDANAATIQAAVDTAVAATVTAGHIVTTGGPLTTTPLTITFSGADVAGANHGQTTIDATSVTGGTAGAASTTTEGHTQRAAWAFLKATGLCTTTPPAQGSDLTSATVIERGSFPYQLDQETVQAVVEEAAYDDGNDTVRSVILAAMGY